MPDSDGRTPSPSASGPGFQLVLRHAMRLIHQDEAQVALDFLDRHRPDDLASLSSWHLARSSALTRMENLEAALEQWTAAEELADERSLEPSERWASSSHAHASNSARAATDTRCASSNAEPALAIWIALRKRLGRENDPARRCRPKSA